MLVYLDLLHWVSLAKANSGHRDGDRFAAVLGACVRALEGGAAVFPISDAIYMEVSKIRQHRQRRDLREVIERVSQYRVVTSRVMIATHEIEALLHEFVGPSSRPINQIDYLDWGVARAFGMVGGFRVRDSQTDEDITGEAAAGYADGPEAFYRKLALAELELNRKTLEGPTADEEPGLRADGWDPRAGYEVAAQRAAQEIEQVGRFNDDPAWRGDRIRDVIAAREVVIEINRMLYEGLADRNASLDDVLDENDIDRTRRFFNSMPSFDVSVSLKAASTATRLTGGGRTISTTSMPSHRRSYCDIVVTDKEAVSHLLQTGAASRFDRPVPESRTSCPCSNRPHPDLGHRYLAGASPPAHRTARKTRARATIPAPAAIRRR